MFFITDDGTHLPWLSPEQFERVRSSCYHFNHGTCSLTSSACLDKNGMLHDQLPEELLPYLREPGTRRHKKVKAAQKKKMRRKLQEEDDESIASPTSEHRLLLARSDLDPWRMEEQSIDLRLGGRMPESLPPASSASATSRK